MYDQCTELFAEQRAAEPQINKPELSLKERLEIFRKKKTE
jgi:hypothetical protein